MTLEVLQEMTDRELDTIAAVKFLWNGIVNVPSDDWHPTTDMNDAMKLTEEFLYVSYYKCGEVSFALCSNEIHHSNHDRERYVADRSGCRAITIAAILAKSA